MGAFFLKLHCVLEQLRFFIQYSPTVQKLPLLSQNGIITTKTTRTERFDFLSVLSDLYG